MNFRYYTILISICLSFLSCKEDESIEPYQELSTEDKRYFNDFINGLTFDASAILELQDISNSSHREKLDEGTTQSGDGNEFIACEVEKYSLQQNFDKVAILRPTDGVVWPGALVKANKNLLNGIPDPVGLRRAPLTLAIDLPGMGDQGAFIVEDPKNSSVQAAVDKALDWWNENAYEEGYANAANSSFQSAISYSKEQLAMDLGLNAKWIGGEASSQFSLTTSNEKKIAMLTFKQVYYKVTFNVPESPAEVFSGNVTLQDLENTFDENTAPAYIHSVSYGRIISFRMETTAAATDAELKAAMEYSTGSKTVNADLETLYKSILNESFVDVFTIGGNAEVASLASQTKDLDVLGEIITGENASYSKNNPGVPIAYSVRFLSDNSLAKLGYQTEYTAENCQVYYKSYVNVDHAAAYVAKYYISYDQNGTSKKVESGDFTSGFSKQLDIPANVENIKVKAEAYTGLFWDPLNTIFEKSFAQNPGNLCFTIKGTTLDTSYDTGDCN